jgi:hypothetical protein
MNKLMLTTAVKAEDKLVSKRKKKKKQPQDKRFKVQKTNQIQSSPKQQKQCSR